MIQHPEKVGLSLSNENDGVILFLVKKQHVVDKSNPMS